VSLNDNTPINPRRKAVMQKESRCCARKVLDREIMIGYPQTGFTRARVRDIGLGGMRVDAAIPLVLDRPVELLLRIPANGSPHTHHWRATVRHISPDSVGLMYEPFVLTELPTLLELLQAADRQAMDDARAGKLPKPGSPADAPRLPAPFTERRQDSRTSGYDQ
jgi:hypothetical protein